MRNQHRIVQKYVFWIVDIMCIAISYYIASGIRYSFDNSQRNEWLLFITMILISLGTIYDLVTEWNSDSFRRGYFQELVDIIKYNFVLFIGYLVYLFIIHMLDITSRLTMLYFLIINIVLMYIVRIAIKYYVRKHYKNDAAYRKILIISDKESINNTKSKFYTGTTYRIIGVVLLDKGRARGMIHGFNIDVSIEDLTKNVVTYSIDDVFFNVPSIPFKDLEKLIYRFEDMGVSCHYALNLPQITATYEKVNVFGDFPVVTYSKSNPSYIQLICKRIMDIIGSAIGLVLCGIVAIFLVPAIKLESPGPAIFSQIRIGKNGRRFKFYKFRSMYIDAEERKKELMDHNQINGLMFKIDDDPRITKVGKFIRKTSLDELPQFWNVLIGDMSLVGTRPPTEDEFEQYDEHYKRRLSMIPGITGLWQISGRSKIQDFDEVVKLDLEYIDNWNILLDIKIILETIIVIFKKEGAE